MTQTPRRTAHRSSCSIAKKLECFVDFASGEKLASRLKPYENGGDIIFARAAWVTVLASAVLAFIGCFVWLLRLMRSDNPSFPPAPLKLDLLILSVTDLTAAFAKNYGQYLLQVFAGAYVAFYARFSAQWTYLADLYNQIKSKEIDLASAPDCVADAQRKSAIIAIEEKNCGNLTCNSAYLLAQWKLGFIEDAFTVHLAKKPLFASVIVNWAKDDIPALLLRSIGDFCG
jgi:hypothetical protein